MSKTAIIFPGIGYHTDKPLLYYSKKLAAESGYHVIEVSYSGFESGIKGNLEKMKRALLPDLRNIEKKFMRELKMSIRKWQSDLRKDDIFLMNI